PRLLQNRAPCLLPLLQTRAPLFRADSSLPPSHKERNEEKQRWVAMSSATGPVVDAEYVAEIERARRDLRALIASKSCAPIMLRLAWHDAGTYDKNTNTGGPDGSIRFPEELRHAANAGLKIAVDLLEPIKQKHPKITYADLYQLAGVVAVEVTGGPTIDFVPGRRDSSVAIEEGRLPDAKQGCFTP
uniref:Plant heme peroxidase family profile domain-containing protein n=1 Tax=Aegilops tauschii subsp. strangulata TaxID=200361 RepID=A0A453AHC9_AEGTS